MRARLRDLGIRMGSFPPGLHNAITDVPGVTVGHTTLIYDTPHTIRTGVTVVLPRGEQSWQDYCFAATHTLNGNGELTGSHWLNESGLLCAPIGLTNTFQVGLVRDALIAYRIAKGYPETASSDLPVVGETWDGWLNDIDRFAVTQEHVLAALESAASGPMAEGNVGGGTGMICHEFKGGIGTASRLVKAGDSTYTLGVLVQANYGDRRLLRLDGVPLGRILGNHDPPVPWLQPRQGGSIIILLATDAPLIPIQCKRLAQRAGLGLARVGGVAHNSSGDIFLAFATGNSIPCESQTIRPLTMLVETALNPFFEATAEATEEAILNALTAAETLTGYQNRTAHALPLDRVQAIWAEYGERSG
jgi:D-aminopeptidase